MPFFFSDKADKSSQIVYPASKSKNKPESQKIEETHKEAKKPHVEDAIIIPTKEGEYPTLPAIFGEKPTFTKEERDNLEGYLRGRVAKAKWQKKEETLAEGGSSTKEYLEGAEAVGESYAHLPDDARLTMPGLEEDPIGVITVDDPYTYHTLLRVAYPNNPESIKSRDTNYVHELEHAQRALQEPGLQVHYGVAISTTEDGKYGIVSPFSYTEGTASKRVFREIWGAPSELSESDKIVLKQFGKNE